MNLEETVKSNLLTRGFSKETQLNNRGLIGATIDETALMIVKNLTIPVVVGQSEQLVCDHPESDLVDIQKGIRLCKCGTWLEEAN